MDHGLFAERLLGVIDEGQRTATYKLALLLALVDATAEAVEPDGRAPDALGTRPVAQHVVALYLPQVRSFPAPDGSELELRQITSTATSSVTVTAVTQLHRSTGATSIDRADAVDPDLCGRTVRVVERNFVRYPVDLLQRVGAESRPFLYTVDDGPDRRVTGSLRMLRFLPGAGDELLRLAPLVRPLIELHWARMVADINGASLLEDRLRAHLFGVDRVTFPESIRAGLADLQAGRCFYCGERLGRATEVDHFVPWSRWPNDVVENLVLADRCNGSKRNHLAAAGHVERWAGRLVAQAGDLGSIAAASNWVSEPSRSLGLARAAYAHVPAGTPLWDGRDRFAPAVPEELTRLLAGVDVA